MEGLGEDCLGQVKQVCREISKLASGRVRHESGDGQVVWRDLLPFDEVDRMILSGCLHDVVQWAGNPQARGAKSYLRHLGPRGSLRLLQTPWRVALADTMLEAKRRASGLNGECCAVGAAAVCYEPLERFRSLIRDLRLRIHVVRLQIRQAKSNRKPLSPQSREESAMGMFTEADEPELLEVN